MTDPNDALARLQEWGRQGGGRIPSSGGTPGEVWMVEDGAFKIPLGRTHPGIVAFAGTGTSVRMFECSSSHRYPHPQRRLAAEDVHVRAGQRGLRERTTVNLTRLYDVPPQALRVLIGTVDDEVFRELVAAYLTYARGQRGRLPPPGVP